MAAEVFMAAPLILDVTRFIDTFRALFANRGTPPSEWSEGAVDGLLSVLLYRGRENIFRLLCIQPPFDKPPYVEFSLLRQDGRLVAQVVCSRQKDEWVVTLGDATTPGVALLKSRIQENTPISLETAAHFVPKLAGMTR